jgi:hypothetical protein
MRIGSYLAILQRQCLRALLNAEQDWDSEFLGLAKGFPALYCKKSKEERLLDAMFFATPR